MGKPPTTQLLSKSWLLQAPTNNCLLDSSKGNLGHGLFWQVKPVRRFHSASAPSFSIAFALAPVLTCPGVRIAGSVSVLFLRYVPSKRPTPTGSLGTPYTALGLVIRQLHIPQICKMRHLIPLRPSKSHPKYWVKGTQPQRN